VAIKNENKKCTKFNKIFHHLHYYDILLQTYVTTFDENSFLRKVMLVYSGVLV